MSGRTMNNGREGALMSIAQCWLNSLDVALVSSVSVSVGAVCRALYDVQGFKSDSSRGLDLLVLSGFNCFLSFLGALGLSVGATQRASSSFLCYQPLRLSLAAIFLTVIVPPFLSKSMGPNDLDKVIAGTIALCACTVIHGVRYALKDNDTTPDRE